MNALCFCVWILRAVSGYRYEMCVKKSEISSQRNAILQCPSNYLVTVTGFTVRTEDGSEQNGDICPWRRMDRYTLTEWLWEDGNDTLKMCNKFQNPCHISQTSFYKQADYYFSRCVFNDWKLCLNYGCSTDKNLVDMCTDLASITTSSSVQFYRSVSNSLCRCFLFGDITSITIKSAEDITTRIRHINGSLIEAYQNHRLSDRYHTIISSGKFTAYLNLSVDNSKALEIDSTPNSKFNSFLWFEAQGAVNYYCKDITRMYNSKVLKFTADALKSDDKTDTVLLYFIGPGVAVSFAATTVVGVLLCIVWKSIKRKIQRFQRGQAEQSSCQRHYTNLNIDESRVASNTFYEETQY